LHAAAYTHTGDDASTVRAGDRSLCRVSKFTDEVPAGEPLARHSFVSTLTWRQSISIERDSFREEQLLKPLLSSVALLMLTVWQW
jgi:hypothetical protein